MSGYVGDLYLLAFCSAVPAVHSDMPVWYGALYCISLDLITRVYCTYIPTAGPTGTHNSTYQQALVLWL